MTEKTISHDGTTIAFERYGSGPALVLVDAAGNYRDFRPLRAPVERLAEHYTVFQYDRRGRGGSSDTPSYAPEREVDDLDAVIEAAGGTAYVYGLSSGGLVALRAAAGGLAIPKLALFEPPFTDGADLAFTAELTALVQAGRRRDAVALFHRGIGVPDEVMAGMTEQSWAALEAVAHTLVYDCVQSDTMTTTLVKEVGRPTLVLDSRGSTGDLTGMAAAVVAALPDATYRSLDGDWHGASDEQVVAALREFLR
jgi:pimeloyl-ACP methyl ester carboxylesterase